MKNTAIAIFLLMLGCAAPKTEEVKEKTNTTEVTPRQIIKTDKAPLPIGPYNQGIVVGNTLYAAGQIAIDPSSNEMVTESIEAEANQVLQNLKQVIEAADFSMDQVVKTTIYMTDLNNFSTVNEIYGKYFKEGNAPARVTVQVAALPKNASLEISMIAVK